MNPKLKSILEALKRDGLDPDPLLDWDALGRLAAACNDLTNPPPTPEEDALLHPAIRVGNVVLYRPSIGARWFLAERVSEWIAADDPLMLAAVAYVLAHARDPVVLWRCSSRTELVSEAAAWIRGVSAAAEELDRAVSEILAPKRVAPAPDAVETPRRPISGATLECLAAEYGIAPEDAVWRHQEAEIVILAHERHERKIAEAGGASNPDGQRVQALVAVQRAEAELREAIRARRRGKNTLGEAKVEDSVRSGGDVNEQRPTSSGNPCEDGGRQKESGDALAPQNRLHESGHDEARKEEDCLNRGTTGSAHVVDGRHVKEDAIA